MAGARLKQLDCAPVRAHHTMAMQGLTLRSMHNLPASLQHQGTAAKL